MICEHWDESVSGSYNIWMISYENFDAGWFNASRRMEDAFWPFATGKEGALADAINGGNYIMPYNRIVYANSHDECWWDGGPYHGKYYPVSEFNGWRGDHWSQKKARMMYTLSFFIPGMPMFFMGDEFAMEGEYNDSRWDNILDCRLEKVVPGPSFLRMFKRLIDIKKNVAPLMQSGSVFYWLHYPSNGWFAFKRKRSADVLIVAGNYAGYDMYGYVVATRGETGNWSQIFNSDGQEFGGEGVGNYGNNPNSYNGSITINIPKDGVVVMNRTSI